jgi:hypothetical protein
MGTSIYLSTLISSCTDPWADTDAKTAVGLPGAGVAAKTNRNLDHEHGRPDPEKFGDADGKPGDDKKEQVGFSSQC